MLCVITWVGSFAHGSFFVGSQRWGDPCDNGVTHPISERPCASQEGGSMLLRREGGFLRRGRGFLKKRRLVRRTGGGPLLQKGGGGFLRRGGGSLRSLWRPLRSSTPSHRPSPCLPNCRLAKVQNSFSLEASLALWGGSRLGFSRLRSLGLILVSSWGLILDL